MNIILTSKYIFFSLVKKEYQNLFFKILNKKLINNFFIYFDYIIKNYIFNHIFNIKQLFYTQVIDSIQKYNYFIQIIIPVIIKNYKNKNYIYKKFLYYTLPIINNNGFFVLNGIKRILLPNLIRFESLDFITYKKNYFEIYTLNFLFYKYNIILIIELDILKNIIYFICPMFNIKINFIHLLYFLNINNNNIIIFSNYGNSNLLKNILYYSTKSYKYTKLNFSIKILYNLLNFINTYKIIKNIYIYITIELIKILDLLLDFFSNKKYYTINHFNGKKINNFTDNIFNFLNINNSFISKNLKYIIFNTNLKKIYLFNLYKEFLLINPLFRILEETNNLSELSNLLKILNYNLYTTSFSIKDFRLNQINNFCILNTTEGVSSGLLLSLTLNTFYNNTNKNCFSTYFNLQHLNNYTIPINLNIEQQEQIKINLKVNSTKKFIYFNKFILPIIWYSNFTFSNINSKNIVKVTLKDLLSPSENLIPFIFFTDPTRCLMGAKMQTQSVPILGYKQALVLTGLENYITYNSDLVYAYQEGIIIYVSSFKIIIRDILNREVIYYLNKYKITNQNTIKYTKPIVWVGERITIGQLLVNNNMSNYEELTLGCPIKVLYGSYFGFDYEDSLITSQQLVYNNIFTSIHIYVYETVYKSYNNNYEYSSIIIPNINIYFKRHLNLYGIIKEGSLVLEKDIIISKIIKKKILPNIKLNNIIHLINLIFGNILYTIYNISIINNQNTCGRIIRVELFIKNYLYIRIFLSSIRLLEIGDKLCGRHGNKGIISHISKNIDLPYMINGEFPDIITGSLGLPSRMNLGQLYEGLFGIKGFYLDTRLIINNNNNNILSINYLKYLLYEYLQQSSFKTSYNTIYNEYDPGRVILRDGRSGDKLKGSSCFGILQYFKLIHMIKDKVHTRTIGDYTNITQQPVKGKSKIGGQRFGEMEVWSLEAFGVSYTLRELLTSRSDDIDSRKSLYNMIIENNEFLTKTNISEPFKIIIKELQSLALNINLSIIYTNINYKIKKILI